jgi:hypothetical protein
VGINAWP